MGPKERPFWLPRTSPVTFFVALLVVGNVLGQAVRSAAAAVPQEPEENVDSRRNSRIPTSEGHRLPAGPAVEKLGTLEAETAPFAWPASLEVPEGRERSQPRAMGFIEWSDFRAELVTDASRRFGGDPVADVGDALLKGPEMLFDEVITCIASLPGRSPLHTWEDEERRTVSARFLDMQFGGAKSADLHGLRAAMDRSRAKVSQLVRGVSGQHGRISEPDGRG